MSKQSEEIKIVNALRSPMLEKLRANSHKTHWRDCFVNDLIEMMEHEIQALKDKLIKMDLPEAKNSCADIANSAAKICDNIDQKFISKEAFNGNVSSKVKEIIDSFFKEVYDKAKKGGKSTICEDLKIKMSTISRWRNNSMKPKIEILDKMWLMIVEVRNERGGAENVDKNNT